MKSTATVLPANERMALTEYINRLLTTTEQHILDIILFGSKARGEANPDSDLDILVIVDTHDGQFDLAATLTASRISLEYNTLLNIHIIPAARWAEMRQWQATLWQQVQHDGVPLLSKPNQKQ